ncbi:MAG: aromatic ring-opening dioxygenase LigA [Nocardioidaceae bacterium]|nr:MAG: aromatic ring-opening dioxygenase LigA [Nocardioidaceae bacterium]
MRKVASWVAIGLGALMFVGGIVTYYVVHDKLSDQNITTSEDACLPNKHVTGPFSAFCEAGAIDKHTREATGGKTYAELEREDPLRVTAMNGAFLQASLFTSVVAFGVAAMASAMGLLFILIGLGMREVSQIAPGSATAT